MSPLLLAIVALLQLHRMLTPNTWVSVSAAGMVTLAVETFEHGGQLAAELGLTDYREDSFGQLISASWVGQILVDEHAPVWVTVTVTRIALPPAAPAALAAVPPTAPTILRPPGVLVADEPPAATGHGVA